MKQTASLPPYEWADTSSCCFVLLGDIFTAAPI